MPAPATLLFAGDALVARRDAATTDDAALVALGERAGEALPVGPFSVVRPDKPTVPGAAPNDFVSLGPYWWPDPERPDGLPWIRRDGEINPSFHHYDRAPMTAMVAAVETLAWRWWFAGDAACAERAALLLRCWFLDPATAMTPHLRFAQGIPGRCTGRGIGIIDTGMLVWALEAEALLRGSPTWNDGDHAALVAWVDALVDWLLASDLGCDERAEHNNHGTWYDVQVVHYARFVGRETVAREILAQVAERRIGPHIATDGSQPHELARTLGMSYSNLNLLGLTMLARHGDALGIDLWRADGGTEAGMEAAARWLLPHLLGTVVWPHQQIKAWRPDDHGLVGWAWLDAAYGLDAVASLFAAYPQVIGPLGRLWT